jgi:hypothetical protein
MANEQNLRPFTSDQNRDEAAKNGRKGGKASGEARRRRKAMREAFEELLARKYTNSKGQEVDGITLICLKQFQNAVDGDTRAFTLIRDTVGEMPVQKIETVEIAPETYEKVRAILEEG